MARLAGYIFGLREDERGTAVLLAAYHFVLLFCLYLLKPVRDGLFLTDRGTGELPLVFLVVAAATIPASLIQRRFGQRYKLHRLTNRLTLVHVVVLVAAGGTVLMDVPGAAYVTYVWVSIYGVMATSQFWVLAGGLLDSAQSRRTFAMLNFGGILGAVVGGEATSALLSTEAVVPMTLLFVAAGLLGATMPLVQWIRARSDAPPSPEPSGAQAEPLPSALRRFARRLRAYPLIGWIAVLVGVVSLVSTVLDFQLKAIASASFATESDLTAFLGRFYGRVSLVALLIQGLLATRLKRYVRSTRALYILPIAIALGSTVLWLLPGLLAVAGLRGADQSLKHSVDKTGRELLYLPLPQQVKRQVKVPVDLVVDQAAHGAAGAILFGLVTGLGVRPEALVPLTLVFVAVWTWAAYRARHAYLRQFRSALHDAVDPSAPEDRNDRAETNQTAEASPTLEPSDREAVMRRLGRYVAFSQALALTLKGGDGGEGGLPSPETLREKRRSEREALFERLHDARDVPESRDVMLALNALEHASQSVRSDAVTFLDGVLDGDVRDLLVPILDDPDGTHALREAPPLLLFLHETLSTQDESPEDAPLNAPDAASLTLDVPRRKASTHTRGRAEPSGGA